MLDIMPAVLVQDADAWALRIAARWRASIESIIETGQLLIDAKAALVHGEFTAMLESSLPFSVNTAQRLMAIARDERISNLARAQLLPPSWTTIFEITKLSDEQIHDAVEQKIIRSDMGREEILALVRPRGSDGRTDEAVARESVPAAVGGFAADGDHTPHSQAGMGSEPSSPSEANVGARLREGCEPSADQEEDSPARPDPLPPQSQKPSGGLAIAHQRVEGADSRDFFPTPPWATRALLEHVLRHLERDQQCKFQIAWEPACGKGHMAEPLKEYFRHVMATDVEDYGYGDCKLDFFTNEAELFGHQRDWIITNPPFNISTEFVLRALKLAGTGVAMFVRLTWLESVGRYERIFRDNPPTQIAIFTERVPLHKGRWEADGVTMTAYVWLVWIKGAAPRAPFWIPPGCREALTKPDDAKRFGEIAIEGQAA